MKFVRNKVKNILYNQGVNMKICIVQCHSINDINKNVNSAKIDIEKAAKKHCDLIVFPELFLTGYSAGEDIKNINFKDISKNIEEIQGLCKKDNIACVIGFPRKENSKVYNSACFIDKNGKILYVYDKTHLFGDEKLVFSKGNKLDVFDSPFGKIGLLICYDIEIPEAARTLAIKGAQIIICISANMKPYDNLHKLNIKSRAIENMIPIIYCNYVGKDKYFEYVGRSNVIDINGNNICKFSRHRKLIYANLDFRNISLDENMNYLNNLRIDLYNYWNKSQTI